ncbi:hypothetical protein [Pseudomonas phage GP100]|nr:hypothetical protein [Pseudomonas phage GP100]
MAAAKKKTPKGFVPFGKGGYKGKDKAKDTKKGKK